MGKNLLKYVMQIWQISITKIIIFLFFYTVEYW